MQMLFNAAGATFANRTSPLSKAALLLGASLLPNAALAQDADEARVQEVSDQIIVTGESIDQYDVLPDRLSDSTFGTLRGLEETPRSVSLVESSLIELFGIQSVNDFVAITPGTFTGNYFGIPGALDIRGERADNFFRGFRRIENRGNFPTAVQASEYVEIVKGPPPVIYGGGKVGGILNFVPKSAKNKDNRLDAPTGGASLTVGTYGKLIGTAEFGTPFDIGGAESGVYVFGLVEDSDHFYRNIYTKNRLLQIAANTDINDKISIEYGGMYQNANLNQSLGWNRVNQELIDSQGARYLGGTPGLDLDANGDGQLSPSEVEPFALEQFAFASPFPFFALSQNQRDAFALDPATVGISPIDHRTVQTERSDFSKSEVWTGYFDILLNLTDDLTIKNQTFYDDVDHSKFSSYGFGADYDAYVFENKTTANINFSPSDLLDIETVLGFSYRKSAGRERESRGRGYQVLDRRDISVGATGNDRFEGPFSGTGNVPFNWDQDGEHTDLGFFGLIDARIGDRVSVLVGARVDNYDVSVFGTTIAGVFDTAEDSDSAFSYNASLNVEPIDDINLYVTYATSEYLELGQGGIVSLETIQSDTWLQDSEVLEAGIKGFLGYGKLYFNLVWYEQNRTSFNTLFGAFDQYESTGVELELRYAVTERLNLTGSATWQDTELLNSPFFLGIPPEVLGFVPEFANDPSRFYGGRFVGVGSQIGINGPIDFPTPSSLYSLNATYTLPQGIGVSVGGTHVASMFSGFAQAVRLPSYTVTRLAAFADIGPFHLRVNANNLFNEKYYTPQFLFWDTFVSPSVGRTVDATLSYKF